MIPVTCNSDSQPPNIFSMLDQQEINGEHSLNRLRRWSHVWRPPTDVYETEDTVVVRVEIAAMRETDFSITLEGRILSIHGIRSESLERRAYHQLEIRFGEFSTEVELPHAVVADEIQAYYSNGLLRIVMPKALPRKVSVDV